MAVTAPDTVNGKAEDDDVLRVVSAAVDIVFYRTVNPDLDAPGFDAIRHYATRGWREGRDPAPWFSVRDYLQLNPDVAAAGVEPLHHYLTIGRFEGRQLSRGKLESYLPLGRATQTTVAFEPRPPVVPEPAPTASPLEISPDDLALAASEFDSEYYLSLYPELADTGVHPLRHFMVDGWREGRSPNARFSAGDYLDANPDLVAAGINPFVHYLRWGRAEGRAPRHGLGFRYDILRHSKPVDRWVKDAVRAGAACRVADAAALRAGLAQARPGLSDLHVTFSHDDYTRTAGGIQLCLQREAEGIAALGRDHLHLYPAVGWPVLRAGEATPLGVVLNGRALGVFRVADIHSVIAELAGPPGARSFAIHTLLGHDVDEVTALLQALGLAGGYLWLHDFESLCAGYHLLRNDVQDCAAPPPDSAACSICIYGGWRVRHLIAFERLFAAFELTVVSPSEPTLALWRESWSFPAEKELVLPHARLVARGPAPVGKDRPFRVAFAGFPASHKGWGAFQQLLFAFEDDPRYEFLHLGGREAPGVHAPFKKAVVSRKDPLAMQRALERAQPDAVLVWPLCRETFSFTAYEAVAAGAAIITNPDSGNVAAFVEAEGHGVILADEAALADAFASGAILDLSRANRRPQLYDLAFSGMTADLLARSSP